ncbi:MAG: hypothetical protein WCY48_11935 [Candidatus Caldatribacteriota bacterium]
MKQLPPLLIFHKNDEFRSMLKDMLIKHGFFYLLDTGDNEVFWELREKNKKHFVLIENNLVDNKIIEQFTSQESHFLILGQTDEKKTHQLSTLFGTSAIMSFPFPSEKLREKIIERSN